ncbi:hypothetical protein [Pseudanabaena sp. FACHB-2040]|uniref:hypothetical protein n=1 Tax=Pseudanabaena sp. FACHB-2040 TaxID=2692859 RepID=UPI0016887191|nr:hypothetical protein [Pseudanabaena sp. FACHB-2040]MBD2256683.1 hypothetical protein [Pseudanabaena sp. FACHB-2040]
MIEFGKKTRQFTTSPIANLATTFCELAAQRSAKRLDIVMKEALSRLASHQISVAITQAVSQLEKDGQKDSASWLQSSWQQYRL